MQSTFHVNIKFFLTLFFTLFILMAKSHAIPVNLRIPISISHLNTVLFTGIQLTSVIDDTGTTPIIDAPLLTEGGSYTTDGIDLDNRRSGDRFILGLVFRLVQASGENIEIEASIKIAILPNNTAVIEGTSSSTSAGYRAITQSSHEPFQLNNHLLPPIDIQVIQVAAMLGAIDNLMFF